MKPNFQRYHDIIRTNPRSDFHIHTSQTDGKATAEEYVIKAIRIGLLEIAFTEHVRRTSHWYMDFVSSIRNLQDRYSSQIRIFFGIETKVIDFQGSLDATGEMLGSAEIIIGSVHSFPSSTNIGNLSVEKAADTEFQLAMTLLANDSIDVLGHPGGVFERTWNIPFPENYYEQIIVKANECNKAIEINSSYIKNPWEFLRLCHKYNPKVSLGSDAHSPEELGKVLTLIKKDQYER